MAAYLYAEFIILEALITQGYFQLLGCLLTSGDDN
jgi:hypothetical protein